MKSPYESGSQEDILWNINTFFLDAELFLNGLVSSLGKFIANPNKALSVFTRMFATDALRRVGAFGQLQVVAEQLLME